MSKRSLAIIFKVISLLFAISLYFVFAAEFGWAFRSIDLYFGIESLIYMVLLLIGLFNSSKVVKFLLAILGLVWLVLWSMVVLSALLSSDVSILFYVQIYLGIAVFVWNCVGAFDRQNKWIKARSEVSN